MTEIGKQYRILLTDNLDRSCRETCIRRGLEADIRDNLTRDQLLEIIGEYDGLIVRSSTHVDSDLLRKANKLRVLGRAGAGVDNIDVEMATRFGVVVMNTPGGNSISAAEHTMALMLSMARHIPEACASLRQGKWERSKFTGMELSGKTLGILGLGQVGREIAKRAQSFGLKTIGYDPVLSVEIAAKMGVELVSIEELLRRSDIITVHTPLNEETRGLIGHSQFELCKEGVKIVNCARGGIIDEDALLRALESGKVGGAALDVFEKEPPIGNSLIQHPNVVATPHLGASTSEAQEKVSRQIAEQVADFFEGKEISGTVNADVLHLASQKELKPFAKLAERMGSFLVQLSKGNLRQLSIICKGSLLSRSSDLILSATMKGMLSHYLSSPVNLINSIAIAKELGISAICKQEGTGGPYSDLLEVECIFGSEIKRIAGTVFNGSLLRIVSIDGFHVEVVPAGHLLLYSNIDRPGILAKMGTILATADINIGGLSLGRTKPGDRALTVLNIDSHINPLVMKELSSVDGVFDVRQIIFPIDKER